MGSVYDGAGVTAVSMSIINFAINVLNIFVIEFVCLAWSEVCSARVTLNEIGRT